MFDAFCKVDGVPSESKDDKHSDWIEILSFSHSIAQQRSATKSSAGGATTGRCDHGEFVIVKQLDKASPKLYEYCSSGKHIKEVVVELWRASGDKKQKYMEFKMEEVLISSVSPGGSAQGGDDIPSEEVRFDYGKIKWTYTQQKRDGSVGGNVTGGWDLTTNKAAA